jgi:hypothetical protein
MSPFFFFSIHYHYVYDVLGGIRCERATALLNQMSSVNPNLKTQGVYELQGGIERYVKTFPEGGYWKGKNYLFDRRLEQTPGSKPLADVEETEVHSKCVICRCKYTSYRGKFQCRHPGGLCGVPVIVCDDCRNSALANPKQLQCELCRVGYKAPQLMPDLVGLKRKAESQVAAIAAAEANNNKESTTTGAADTNPNNKRPKKGSVISDRLFLSRLPLTATKTKLSDLLGCGAEKIKVLHWLTDKNTGGFYGSCIVQLASKEDAETVVARTSLKMEKKKVKVTYYNKTGGKDDEESCCWPPDNLVDQEYPPIGS